MENLKEYISKKIKTIKTEGGCLEIVKGAYPEKQGYYLTSIKINNEYKRIRAHRLFYMAYKGIITNKDVIRHSCDNNKCVNPDHLLKGTKKDNTRDMLNRHRESKWTDRKGKKQKLSNQDILNIYLSKESSYDLEKKYNVTSTQIRRIKNGSRCSNITKHGK